MNVNISNILTSKDGIHWERAKQIPYYPNMWEKLACAFGFHDLRESKKYEGCKYCFKCGKRKIYREYAY